MVRGAARRAEAARECGQAGRGVGAARPIRDLDPHSLHLDLVATRGSCDGVAETLHRL